MTGGVKNFNGIPVSVPNDITKETKDFYISFNSRDSYIYGDVTTALVDKNQSKFLILNGNHTEQYNNIVSNGGGYAECVEYFESHISMKSKFSDDISDEEELLI